MAQDISEADILSEVIAPDQPGLPPESARSILELAFSEQARQRMDELAEKNRQGTVIEGERVEMEKYLRVGNFINLMQAKARRSLRESAWMVRGFQSCQEPYQPQGASPRLERREPGASALRLMTLNCLLATFLLLFTCASAHAESPVAPNIATFSIVAYDPETEEWGVAVQSKFVAVGAVVPVAKAGVGAIATQAFANTTYGPKGLELLGKGKSAQETLELLVKDDPRRERRQVGIVDAKGGTATFTGEKCLAWAGGREGKHYVVQGNILAGKGVVDAMAETFEKTEGDLGNRLLAALAAGQRAGGDRRGRQSAALLIVKKNGGYAGYNDRYRDLRVDDHAEPIKELQRIYALHKKVFPARRR